ncbi:MAG: 4-alpha-glucanotransferase [Eubacteriales bacterium]|nr:4-alpha-glucanotransferase [Eubacteriales bacterium]
MTRSSGILMPMSSLPSPYGIGTMGKAAYEFVDFLKAAGQKYWQLLPMGPTSYGDSPYASFSTFAGNPYFIDLDMLVEEGLLKKTDLIGIRWSVKKDRVDYGLIFQSRFKVLRKAWQNGREALSEEIAVFRRENAGWLEDYALFMAVKGKFNLAGWTQWPDEDIRLHKPEAVEKYGRELKEEVDFYVFMQFLFFRQWEALRAYAKEAGVQFIGDIPIYVAMDSADVWSAPQYFQLDGENVPTEVSGVPPDAFTEDGQLWGNPLYNWQRLEETGFDWWIRRMSAAARLYDVIRIDHFRGLESYYAVPCGEKTARHGRWIKGPGMKLITAIKNGVKGAEFIAEDLGYTTDEVRALLAQSGFPGMRVLQFAFDGLCPNEHQPHAYSQNSICYTGTHDNSPIALWREETSQAVLDYARKYMAVSDTADMGEAMIRLGMASVAKLFIAQMQDHLGLSYGSRINVPGTACGNWQWRMDKAADLDALAAKLYEQAELYARI